MKFSYFSNHINSLKTNELGGKSSQFKLVPELRIKFSEEKIKDNNPKKAAVLAVLYPNKAGESILLLTLRASYNGAHSAQISLPGGKVDKVDTSLKATALREFEEEIGINRDRIQVIRKLSETYIPPSNFMVTPFLGYLDEKPDFQPNEEVAEIIEVKVADLVDDNLVTSVTMETSYMKEIEVPCFNFSDHIVWGATAMILSEIKDLIKEIQ